MTHSPRKPHGGGSEKEQAFRDRFCREGEVIVLYMSIRGEALPAKNLHQCGGVRV